MEVSEKNSDAERIKISNDYYYNKGTNEQLIPCVIEPHYRDGDDIFITNIFFIKPNKTFIEFKDYLFKDKKKPGLSIQPDAVSFFIYGDLKKKIDDSDEANKDMRTTYNKHVCICDCLLYMSYIVKK